MELDEAVAITLALFAATFNSYLKVTPDMGKAWLMAFKMRGLTDVPLVERTAQWALANFDHFPTPKAFIDQAMKLKGEPHTSIGVPVGDDTVRIEWVPVEDAMSEPRRVPSLEQVRVTPDLPAPKRVPKTYPDDDRDVETWKADQIRRLKDGSEA